MADRMELNPGDIYAGWTFVEQLVNSYAFELNDDHDTATPPQTFAVTFEMIDEGAATTPDEQMDRILEILAGVPIRMSLSASMEPTPIAEPEHPLHLMRRARAHRVRWQES